MIVPSVQELAKQRIINIPPRYLRPHQDPPFLPPHTSLPSVPIIDFHFLAAGADFELERLHSACRDWGFFQVINHGVSTSLLEKLKLEVENFFKPSYDEKKKPWQEPDNHEGFGQRFVVSESKS